MKPLHPWKVSVEKPARIQDNLRDSIVLATYQKYRIPEPLPRAHHVAASLKPEREFSRDLIKNH